MKFPCPRRCLHWLLLLLALPGIALADTFSLPDEVGGNLRILRSEREGLWEKTLLVQFPETRRVLSTSDGLLDARAAINHAAHPGLWHQLGGGSKDYTVRIREQVAGNSGIPAASTAMMSTAADMDNLAQVTLRHGPLTITVLATAGAKTNAIRTGVDAGTYIEGEAPAGTINIMVLSNIALSDAALARALITITEGKTAALEDLAVPSSYTARAQATGTGTDSIIVVSGTAAPRATYTGGHSRIGELIGKATYQAVVEALGKQNGFFLPGSKRFAAPPGGPAKAAGDLRLALLHLDATPGDIAGNRARIEQAIREAVRQGADWVITPELAETGYFFTKRIGTDWIAPFPDTWITTLTAIARDNQVALFVGFAERDPKANTLHNSVAVIDRQGRLLGTYRKQRVHGGAEAWSLAGRGGEPFMVDDVAVGTLVCADTYVPELAQQLAARGASILLAPTNWPPVDGMGPGDIWERRSEETGIPLIVVNRAGKEAELDFSAGQSAVSVNGQRLFSFAAPHGKIFYVDWNRKGDFKHIQP